MRKVAVLVDGGFYRRIALKVWGEKDAAGRADELIQYCKLHVGDDELYRIFYYDCPPLSKKVFHPLLEKTVDLNASELFKWMSAFIECMKQKRKVAIRLGRLSERDLYYTIRQDVVKKIVRGSLAIDDLKEQHFVLNVRQKGVDMKIGVDISSMAFKKQVDKMVLISGDSDFVPAAKLARREGVDFVLDAMHQPINPDLSEHIDGLHSCFKRSELYSGPDRTFKLEESAMPTR